MGKKILELVFQDKRDPIDHTCDMIRKRLQTAIPQGVTLSNIVGKIQAALEEILDLSQPTPSPD